MPAATLPRLAPRPPPHLPRGTRAFARPGVARMRLGRRLAAGLTAAQAAATEGLAEADVTALLADPDFAGLIDACRELEAMPEDDRRQRLVLLARDLLEDAVTLGDLRAAMFLLREEHAGRDPARTLADGVVAAGRRAARAVARAAAAPDAPAPAAAPPPPRPAQRRAEGSSWPFGPGAAARVAARLRHALASDDAALAAAAPPASAPRVTRPEPPRSKAAEPPRAAAPAPPTSGAPSLNRHQRRRRAALERRNRPRPPHPPPAA